MAEEPPGLAGVDHRFVQLPGLRMHVAEAGGGDLELEPIPDAAHFAVDEQREAVLDAILRYLARA